MQAAIEAQKKIRIYPLSTSANPKAYEFVDRTNDLSVLLWEDNIEFWGEAAQDR